MAIPKKAHFNEVADLKHQWERMYLDWNKHSISELKREACEEFANRVYDYNQNMLTQMERLHAWKWLQADSNWKFARKELFKTEKPKRVSRDDFVFKLSARLMDEAAPKTKEKYDLEIEFRNKIRASQRQQMLKQAYSEEEIEKFLEQDPLYKLESICEFNSESERLKRLNHLADYYILVAQGNPDIELLIVDAIGRYFYDQEYLVDYTVNEPDQDYIEEAEEWDSNIERGCKAIEDLMPLLEEHLELSEDFADALDTDKYKKMIAWLSEFKEKLERNHGALFDSIDDEHGSVVVH